VEKCVCDHQTTGKSEFSKTCAGRSIILLILSDIYVSIITQNLQNTMQGRVSEWAYVCPFAKSYSGNGYHSILTKFLIDGLGYLSRQVKCFED
jgi:hypothetical protein